MKLSSHVLDTVTGAPATPIFIALDAIVPAARESDREMRSRLAHGVTDADGRWSRPTLDALALGTYELTFHVGSYFRERSVATFYDTIAIRFKIDDAERNYHIPLLLSPFGYTTYRGS